MSFEPVSLSKTEVGALSERIDWEKVGGLVPAIVQDYQSSQVLMMGYMNPAALEKTGETGQVTFFSRTKERLWTKGDTSGNVLQLQNMPWTVTATPYWLKLIPLAQHATLVQQRAGTEINNKSLRWCGFISLSSYWLPARTPILNLLILPAYMPVAPSVFRKKWAKKALKSRLRRRRAIRRS